MILKIMSFFFGNSDKHLKTLPLIGFEKFNIGSVLTKFSTIISKLNSYQEYKTFYGHLDGLPLLIESLDEITNPDNVMKQELLTQKCLKLILCVQKENLKDLKY